MSETITFTTCKDARQAKAIGRALVKEKLAAFFFNDTATTEIYTWEGRTEEASEVLLLIKSRAALSKKLVSRIRALHSYEVPEVVTLPISSGNPAYLRWVRESTR